MRRLRGAGSSRLVSLVIGPSERQRRDRWVEPVGEAGRVLRDLRVDADERLARLLRLQHADRLAIHEQQVVGVAVAGLELELAYRDTLRRRQVHLGAVLHDPAGRSERRVDLDPGCGLGPRGWRRWRHGGVTEDSTGDQPSSDILRPDRMANARRPVLPRTPAEAVRDVEIMRDALRADTHHDRECCATANGKRAFDLRQQAHAAAQQGYLQDAVELLQQAIALLPLDVDTVGLAAARHDLANALINSRNHPGAIHRVSELLEQAVASEARRRYPRRWAVSVACSVRDFARRRRMKPTQLERHRSSIARRRS